MPICYLAGAGDFTATDFTPQPGDLVIAADAGYCALKGIGILPHLVVGDFDSLGERPVDVPALAYPAEKDDTDMGIAIEEGWARGYRSFRLYGADGGRLDHYLANLQLLGGLSARGGEARMVCAAYEMYGLTNGTLRLPPRKRGTLVSVFCHGSRAEGVTLTGLKYPLHLATLTCDRPLGVSNEVAGAEASVTVGQGTLLVYVAR